MRPRRRHRPVTADVADPTGATQPRRVRGRARPGRAASSATRRAGGWATRDVFSVRWQDPAIVLRHSRGRLSTVEQTGTRGWQTARVVGPVRGEKTPRLAE